MLDDLLGPAERLDHAQVMRGQIKRAPATNTDSMTVIVPAYSTDHDYEVPATQWLPRAALPPTAGAWCVVMIDSEGDTWVPVIEGVTDFISSAPDPSSLVGSRGAKAASNATTGVPNGAWTEVLFAVDSYNPDGMHSTVTNVGRLTIVQAGWYAVSATLPWPTNSTGGRRITELRRNSDSNGTAASLIARDESVGVSWAGSTSPTINVSGVAYFTAGEWVSLGCYQDSGTTLQVGGTGPPATISAAAVVGPKGDPGAAGGTGAVVTSLPAGVDGLEVYYLADAATGVIWHLKYRAASTSAYKWEVIGGSPLRQGASAGNTMLFGSQTTKTAATDISPITLPLAGDYDFNFGFGAVGNNGAWSSAYDILVALDINGTISVQPFFTATGTYSSGTCSALEKRTVTAGAVATLMWWMPAPNAASRARDGWISAMPVRVG
jgi:hypothetical protein